MAIANGALYWLGKIHGCKVFKGNSVLELGPSNVMTSDDFLQRIYGDDTDVYDYIFAVLRERGNAPFKYPRQGISHLLVG